MTSVFVELVGWVAAGTAAVAILRAGVHERAGRLDEARRLVRRSGIALAIGAVLTAIIVGAHGLTALPSETMEPVWLLSSAALVLLAGWSALLAGLSGKPRPTGQAALLLWVLAAAARLAATAC